MKAVNSCGWIHKSTKEGYTPMPIKVFPSYGLLEFRKSVTKRMHKKMAYVSGSSHWKTIESRAKFLTPVGVNFAC